MFNCKRKTTDETQLSDSGDLKSNSLFDFSFVDHFIVRKTLDEGLYLVYTFQVQKDKSKFLGLNGTKLDIIVRLHLLVFLNQITFFYLVCKKISFFY